MVQYVMGRKEKGPGVAAEELEKFLLHPQQIVRESATQKREILRGATKPDGHRKPRGIFSKWEPGGLVPRR